MGRKSKYTKKKGGASNTSSALSLSSIEPFISSNEASSGLESSESRKINKAKSRRRLRRGKSLYTGKKPFPSPPWAFRQEKKTVSPSAPPASEILPQLPDGWEEKRTEKGKPYYIDHNWGVTQWERPIPDTFLPGGRYAEMPEKLKKIRAKPGEGRFAARKTCMDNYEK